MRRTRRAAMIGMLAAATIAACSPESSNVTAVGSEPEPTTTTVAETTTTTSTTTTTTTAPPPTTTTTAKPVVKTTTTTVPDRAFRLSPTSGGRNTTIIASGTGCTGGKDRGIGVAEYDANGNQYSGDGSYVMPSGNWDLQVSNPANSIGSPGDRFKYVATCTVDNVPAFTYPPAYFTFTG